MPWSDEPLNLTGGPNGIPGIDDLRSSASTSRASTTTTSPLILLALVVLSRTSTESRTGRALRAIREDPLAAETMTIPVNRLKLLAFVLGAAVAGLAGTIFAAVQVGRFPRTSR